jgi:hypothetical protein
MQENRYLSIDILLNPNDSISQKFINAYYKLNSTEIEDVMEFSVPLTTLLKLWRSHKAHNDFVSFWQ